MLTNSSQYVSCQKSGSKKIILITVYVLSGILALSLHYFCNTDYSSNKSMFSYLAWLTLFSTLSANCAAGLIDGLLRRRTTVTYMLIAAIVGVIEVIPFPFCKPYFSMSEYTQGMIRDLWMQTAFIIAIILLLTAVINFLRKKYKINISISIEKIKSSENSGL